MCRPMRRHLWLLLSLLLGCIICTVVESTECILRLDGTGNGPEASLQCRDGSVHLAFNTAVRVVQNENSGRVVTSKTCKVDGCIITICDSTAVFRTSSVSNVQLEASLEEKEGIICVNGNSNVTFEGLTVYSSYGSGIFARDNARVVISNSSFTGGRAKGGAGVLALGYTDVVIKDSVFSGNTVDGYYGGGGLAAGENATVRLEKSVVTQNTAELLYAGGGVAVVDDAKMVISNSTIRQNVADGGGAGIATFYNAVLLITDGSTIMYNNASSDFFGGGLAISESSHVTITGASLLQGNTAELTSGGGLAVSGPNATLLCTGNSIICDSVGAVGGAASVAGSAKFVMGDSTGSCFFSNNTSPMGPDINAGRGAHLLFNNTNINMSSDTVLWTRKKCMLGETLQVICQECRPGTYSLNPKNESCDLCPAVGANCTGGAALIPVAGWWHAGGNSTQFHHCPHTQSVCLYGGGCAQGYAGNLCGSCAAGYAANGPFHCVECGPLGRNWAVYLLASLLSVGLVAVTAHATWRDNQDGENDLKPSHMLHVVIMLGQYLLLISTLPLDWPQTLDTTLRAFSTVFGAFGGHAASLDCILQGLGHVTSVPVAITRQLATLFAPPAMFVAVVLLNLVWWGGKCLLYQLLMLTAPLHTVKKLSRTLGLQTKPVSMAKLLVTALVVLGVSYPFLVRMSLGFFACIPLDNPRSPVDPYPQYAVANALHGYWVNDMQQACWSGYHLRWGLFMGIPCVAVFCIGIPVAIVLWLSGHTEASESDPQFKERYGILYRNFRPNRFWFESVLRLVMSAVCAISAFRYTLGSYYATLLMNGAFGSYCGLQLVLKPYNSNILSRMQLLAFLCLYFVTYTALTLFTVDTDAGTRYKQAAGIIALACVVAYLLWCVILIAGHSKQLIMQVVGCLVPCFKKPQAGLPTSLAESLPTTKDVGRQ